MSVRVGDEIVAGGQGDMYIKAQVDALIASAIAQTTEKPGMIKPFAGTTIPTGYLLCDGSAVSRTTYADLFAAIGTVYGDGDGSTTFNLPNYNERTLWQSTSSIPGISYTGRVPNITGFPDLWYYGSGTANALGAFYNTLEPQRGYNVYITPMSGNIYAQLLSFDASRVSSSYGRGHTSGDDDSVIPRSLSCKFCIKY